ncbi:MAG: hypothetical protein L3J03_11410 [Desulfobacterales bacterium]|nr:hypothetical protein [Desulfobacterales bacterium]
MIMDCYGSLFAPAGEKNNNRSPGVRIYGNLMPVSVYQWLRFVHSGLRSILVLFEQAR